MDTRSEIIVDCSPFFRVYADRRVERLIGNDMVPVGYDASTGVTSKDVEIDSGVNVRIFLPEVAVRSPEDGKKLPVIVYFHGGGFVAMSAASSTHKAFQNSLAAKAGALVVSVNYRLATEHPLPIGYEDSFRALEWVLRSGGDEPWLSRHGDLGRVFLAGDSAGGNIAHNVAMMAAAGRLGTDAASPIVGVVLLHPGFWGKDPLGGETKEVAAFMETLWHVVFPGATDGVDDPRMNPRHAGVLGVQGRGPLLLPPRT